MTRTRPYRIRFLMSAVVALYAAPAEVSATPIGFSVRADTGDRIFAIDLLTGKATDYGQLGFGAEGLASLDGRIYGIDGDTTITDQLWNVTPSGLPVWPPVPVGYPIGPTGPREGLDAGLSQHSDGALYNLQGLPSYDAPASHLYQLSTTTGAATLVGQSGVYADSLAINAEGDAFAVDAKVTDSLYRVDLATGNMTRVGSLGLGDILLHTGLAFDQDGVLWMITTGITAAASQIYRIDPTTGAAVFAAIVTVDIPGLGTFGKNGFQSLAIDMGRLSETASLEAVHAREPGTLGLVGMFGLGWFGRRICCRFPRSSHTA